MDPSMQASFPSNPNLQGSMGSPYMGGYPPDGYTSHGFNSDYSTKMANIKAMGNGMLSNDSYPHYGSRQMLQDMSYSAAGMGQYPPSYERSYPGQHPSMGMPPSSMGGGYRVPPMGHHDGGMGQWSASTQHPPIATQQGPVEWGHPHHQSTQHAMSAHTQDQFAAHPPSWPPGNQYPGYSAGHHGDPYRPPAVLQGPVMQASSQSDPMMANREGRYLAYHQGGNPAMNSHCPVGTPTHPSHQSAGSSSNLYNQDLPPNAVAPPPYTGQTGDLPGRHWGGGALPSLQHSAVSHSSGVSRPEVTANSQGLAPDETKVEDSVDKEEDSEIVKDLLSDASNGNDEGVANTAGGGTPSPLLSPTILPQGSVTNLRNAHQMTPPQPEQQRTLTSPTQHPYPETTSGFERTNSRSLSTSSDAEQAQRGSVQAGQTDPSDSNVSTPLQQLSDERLSSSFQDLHQPSSVGTPQSSYPEEQMSQGSQPTQQQQAWTPNVQQPPLQQRTLQPQTVEGERGRIPSGTPPLQTEGVKSTPPLTDPPQQPGSGIPPYAMSAGSSMMPQFKQYPRASPSWSSYKERMGGPTVYQQPGYPGGPAPNSGYPQLRQVYESEYSPATYGRHSFVMPHPTAGHPLQHPGLEGVPGGHHPPQPYSAHYPSYQSLQMHPYHQQQQQRNMAMYPSQMSRQLQHQQEMAAYHHHQQQQQAQRQQQQLAMHARYAASGYTHPPNRGMPLMPAGYHPSSAQGHHFSMSPSSSASSIERESLHKSTIMQKQHQAAAQPDSWSRGSPQRPPSTGSSASQPPTPQPPMSRTKSNDKPHYPEGKTVTTAAHLAKSESSAVREGAVKRGRIHDWSTTVEGVSPQLMKFRRMMPQDCGQVEPLRLVMSLKSGIMSEATWAIDTLNVMLADDRTAMYFNMYNHQPLLTAIVDHFYRCLTEIFGDVFSEDPNDSKENDSGLSSSVGSSVGAIKETADSCEVGQYEMKASPRTVAQSSNATCVGPLGQAVCTDLVDVSASLEDYSHIDVDYSSRHCNFPSHEPFHSNLDKMRLKALQVGTYHRIDEQHPFSLRARRWRRGRSWSESSNSSETSMDVSASGVDTGKQAHGSLAAPASPCEEHEVCSKVESPLWTIPPDKEVLQQRCLCLSNILRSLSFIPGNDTEFSKHPRLLRLLGVLLLLHHVHILQLPKKTSAFAAEDDPEDIDCEKEACPDETSCSADYWWQDCLRGLRESVFIILSNISGQLDLSLYPESVTLPLVDGLLHWAVCPASEAVEQFASSALAFNLSPQRMVVEALAKISIADVNVDYILATPPLARQKTLYTHLVKFLGLKDQPVMKQFSLVLLSNLAQGDEAASFLIGHQKMVISHLVECLELVESHARRNKVLPTPVAQNSFEDDPVMSVAMLRRAAVTLHCLAKVTSNRDCFLECLDRILYLSTSDYLEPSVSGIVMDLLFELGKQPPTSSS